jgi:RpiR family carbohydrate utilization transcriptional regulator
MPNTGGTHPPGRATVREDETSRRSEPARKAEAAGNAEGLGQAGGARAGKGANETGAAGGHVLDRLSRAVQTMRPSERKVASVVLADPGAVVSMSMAALAEAAQVSEPTVMRFCAGAGFNGFQAFKFGLAQALALGKPVTYSAIELDDEPAELITKIFDHTLNSLDGARRSLDPRPVADAIELLLAAAEVLFVGQGASGLLAQDAVQKGVLFGVPCAAPIDPHEAFMAAAMATPRTVVVAISNTGRTISVLDTAARAKRSGAKVIAVVGGPSPLLDLADIGIVLHTSEDTNIYTPTISRLAGLVLIDVLATGVAIRRGPQHLERLRQMKEALSAFRGSTSDPDEG